MDDSYILHPDKEYLAGRMDEKEYYDWVFSWIKSHRKYMSRLQYKNIINLYNDLAGQSYRKLEKERRHYD